MPYPGIGPQPNMRTRKSGSAATARKNKAGKTRAGLAGLIQFREPCGALLQRGIRAENMKPEMHMPLMGKRLDVQVVAVVDIFADFKH